VCRLVNLVEEGSLLAVTLIRCSSGVVRGDSGAKKAKEQADSQSLATPEFPSTAHKTAPTAHPSGNASSTSVLDAAAQLDPAALGSLSTHRILGEARKAEQDAASSKKKGGALSNLIYGTVEGQQMDKDMERSFSQVLARGKYVHSIVFHEVKPDKVDEYVELVGGWYPRMASIPENKVNLVGSWRSEVGDCDTFGLEMFLLKISDSMTDLV
jgi:hypothetical protein